MRFDALGFKYVNRFGVDMILKKHEKKIRLDKRFIVLTITGSIVIMLVAIALLIMVGIFIIRFLNG